MRFACDKCSAKFTIADEKVRGKIVAVKCSKCGNKITVNGKSLPEPEPEIPDVKPVEESTRMVSLEALEALRQGAKVEDAPKAKAAAPAPAPAPAPVKAAPKAPPKPELPSDFYAMVNGAQIGPLAADDLRSQVSLATITDRTYVWRDGMADWVKAGDVAELSSLFQEEPPAPVEKPKPAPVKKAPPPPDDMDAAMNSTMLGSPGFDADSTMLAPKGFEAQQLLAKVRADEESHDEATLPPPQEEKAPAKKNGAAPSPSALSDDLFDSGDMHLTSTAAKPLDLASMVANDVGKGKRNTGSQPAAKQEARGEEHDQGDAGVDGDEDNGADPFASVPDNAAISKPGEIGEQTRFFIAQSGVNKRNAPWKIATFVACCIGLPVAILYLLSNLRIVPLEVTTVDEVTGEEVKTSVFSGAGVAGLRDALMGTKKKPVAKPPPVVTDNGAGPKTPKSTLPRGDTDGAIIKKNEVKTGMTAEQIAELKSKYENDSEIPKSGGPKVRKNEEKVAVDGEGGLSPKVINDTVQKSAKAFQDCTENEIRRNPNFKGGKIEITVSIGPSGIVTRAAIDKADVENTTLGSCLKDKAKRVVFPAFTGDAVDAVFPLVLANGG